MTVQQFNMIFCFAGQDSSVRCHEHYEEKDRNNHSERNPSEHRDGQGALWDGLFLSFHLRNSF